MPDASRFTAQIAVGVAAVGFLLIVLGWNGAAGLDRVPSQMPYIISGGLAGFALVAVGLTLVLVNELRRTTSEITGQLQQLADVAGSPAASGPTPVPELGGETVVAGRTTYHLPTCRLVVERTDLQHMAPAAATDRGLAACRICDASTTRATA